MREVAPVTRWFLKQGAAVAFEGTSTALLLEQYEVGPCRLWSATVGRMKQVDGRSLSPARRNFEMRAKDVRDFFTQVDTPLAAGA
jgi:hypothetical protein